LVYLDPVNADTGALRVVPGSHRFNDAFANDVHRGITDSNESTLVDPAEAWGIAGPEVPAIALPSEPGDAILLNRMTAHASFGGGARRRLINAIFFPRLAEAELDQLRSGSRVMGFTKRRLFGDEWPILRDASPRRLVHLEQIVEHTHDDQVPLHKLFGLNLQKFSDPVASDG
jgi:ectoine hydroxylase-related dioxygenase (phytanoyl-CoA dioxygenase family)